MAVEDHEVHEKVKIGKDFRYGCNSVRNPNRSMHGYFAPDRRYKPDGTFYVIQVRIPHVMSKPCRSFYLWDTDPACADCQTTKDFEYKERMESLK